MVSHILIHTPSEIQAVAILYFVKVCVKFMVGVAAVVVVVTMVAEVLVWTEAVVNVRVGWLIVGVLVTVVKIVSEFAVTLPPTIDVGLDA